MFSLDYIFFAAAVTLLAIVLLGWLWYRDVLRVVSMIFGLVLVFLLVGAKLMADAAGEREKSRLREAVAGLAPTYAAEIERMGHASLTFNTPGGDANYLQIIEAEKRWLKANPRIASMYTYRLDQEGKMRFVVACETDYNRDGKYEGESEARIEIGEIYPEEDASMAAAFRGEALFGEEPEKDRWGTWVAAYYPLRGSGGEIEAVVGLDLDASEWLTQVQRVRRFVLVGCGLGAVFGLTMLGGLGMWMMAREQKAQLREAEVLRSERLKFETLVDSIEGVVFEADSESGRFAYVSRQAAALLDCPLSAWTEKPGFLEARMYVDDRDWAAPARAAALKKGSEYLLEYRILNDRGDMIWLRERGRQALAGTGKFEEGIVRGILDDITAQKAAGEELDYAHRQLVLTSRQAGMAEVATGVLHNVGNVLNSVNISSTVIHDQLRQSRVSFLQQLSSLIDEQGGNLPEFIRDDERGRMIPGFLRDLASRITCEHELIARELKGLVSNVEHIKDIVLMQQDYARLSGRTEKLDLAALLDDAIRINESAFARHRIRLIKQIEPVPVVLAERGKVLQILVNLIRNAKHALDESKAEDRVLTLAISKNGGHHVKVSVTDNGVGIAPEVLPRICTYGFTTRVQGHGFGLHSGAAAARDMGGSLSVASPGVGKGATFTLELPTSVESMETIATSLN